MSIEILKELPEQRPKIKTAVFDFDGTISTLRCGWENVMEIVMLEFVGQVCVLTDEIKAQVCDYIDKSTGIQTVFQMDWFVDYLHNLSPNCSLSKDPWVYKDAYNDRLMETVNERRRQMDLGKLSEEDYLIAGVRAFVLALREKGVTICVASGTDDPDVQNEARVLGMFDLFDQLKGAPLRRKDCSKEAVLRDLIESQGLKGGELLVVGDGKVEIQLGNEFGTITLGTATDEISRCGVNPSKRQRLINAGAHAIVGDFTDTNALMNWLQL
jgi:phosphoglycolate phosphatase-like HAD superfamily hydrolase